MKKNILTAMLIAFGLTLLAQQSQEVSSSKASPNGAKARENKTDAGSTAISSSRASSAPENKTRKPANTKEISATKKADK